MRNSKIILVKNINLDRDYINVLDYTTEQMIELCNQNKVAEANDYSFIRTNRSIMTSFTYEQCLQANYIAFQNSDYSNKWFFAWIDEVNYKGDRNTELTYTIDSWSTWFDNWKAKTCFVLREHVNDDTVGTHTIQEDLNIGQIISDREQMIDNIGADSFYYFVIASNYDPSNETRYAGVGLYGNYPQGCMWFAWLVNINSPESTINDISNWLYDITVKQHANDIQNVFALPYQAFNLEDIDATSHLVKNGGGRKIDELVVLSKSLYRSFDGYTPKNNKLYTYPYSFVRITNNLGSYNDYKIENFIETNNENQVTDNMTFNVRGVPCLSYSGKITPKFYKGLASNEDESITLGKYPALSWSTDAFTNWLTQNAVNLTVSAISTAGSLASMNPSALMKAGAVSSISSGIAGIIGSVYNASMLPNTAQGNANAGDLSFSFNLARFKIMHMRPKLEYLRIIDDYFTRFGYQINRVKVPNIKGRRYWNYVEIGQSEEIGTGTVPTKFMVNINNACKKGVTIWHNHANIGNFNLDNSII